MRNSIFEFPSSRPSVVGSIGDIVSLRESTAETLAVQCDIAEIRLDLFHREFETAGPDLWKHLKPFPLLFTARCGTEGSPVNLDLSQRSAMLEAALLDASLIDIELASADPMSELIGKMKSAGLPWIASFHDFEALPPTSDLESKSRDAQHSGASAFKVAARLKSISDLAKLASFQKSHPEGSLATMGMGPLGPVSRLLCAQAGSVLNYGFVGSAETAPGQWSARQLLEGIRSLQPIHALSI